MKKRVLLVDDDRKLRELLHEYLTDYGFEVRELADGRAVASELRNGPPELVILDIMLPGKDGLEILREIRRESAVPVIMLTARGDDADRIVGLELGADDYLPKPFNPRELLARIRAVLRRTEERSPSSPEDDLQLSAGGLRLNRARQSVTRSGKEIALSTTEFKVLEALMTHPNQVLSRDRLLSLARGRDFVAYDRSIDVHISKLRSKLEGDPRNPRRIRTVWGSGYMLVDEPE